METRPSPPAPVHRQVCVFQVGDELDNRHLPAQSVAVRLCPVSLVGRRLRRLAEEVVERLERGRVISEAQVRQPEVVGNERAGNEGVRLLETVEGRLITLALEPFDAFDQLRLRGALGLTGIRRGAPRRHRLASPHQRDHGHERGPPPSVTSRRCHRRRSLAAETTGRGGARGQRGRWGRAQGQIGTFRETQRHAPQSRGDPPRLRDIWPSRQSVLYGGNAAWVARARMGAAPPRATAAGGRIPRGRLGRPSSASIGGGQGSSPRPGQQRRESPRRTRALGCVGNRGAEPWP